MMFPPDGWKAYQDHRAEIAALLDPRCYTIEWLDCEILNGAIRVMGDDRAVIAFEVKNYPTGALELHGMVAAGELPAILGLIEQAEEWARAQGIAFASIASRPGWARVLAGRGYAVDQVTIKKDLRHGA